MVKEIVTDVEALSERSDEFNIRKEGELFRSTVLNLKDTIIANDLPCLSAIQIGVAKRVFSIRFGDSRKVYCNPVISNCQQFTLNREKSASIPGKEFIVPRYGVIEASYQNPLGVPQSAKFIGAAAFAFQQMVDLLEGILISDIGMEIDENFDKATDDERAEVIKMYCEALDVRIKELHEDIEKNENLKKMDSALKFMDSVREGKTVLEHS